MQALPLLQDDVALLKVLRAAGAAIFAIVVVGGCASHRGIVAPATPGAAGSASTARPGAPTESTAEIAGQLMSPKDLARLSALSRQRASLDAPVDYRIGPDDLLEIQVPDLTDSRLSSTSSGGRVDTTQPVASAPSAERGVRVSHGGTIELPMLGKVRAEGSTPGEVADEIARQLVSRGILRKPEVSVVVTEFRGRAVTIVGSVTKPGTYPLSKPGATLVDMILVAGGPTESAGRIVHFTPAEDAITTGRADAPRGGPSAPSRAHPIRIDLEVLLRSGPTDPDLNPPARPGDLVRVAEEGTVQVDGWVDKPGTFPATSTTTLTGVLAAASPQYAADLGGVTVRRTLSPGEQRTYTIDVALVAEGGIPDFPLTDGDVVTVPMHAGKVIPYSVYTVGKSVINVGVGGMVPLF